MKAIEKIRTKHRLLLLLLALMLAAGNVAFSSHVSSHAASDSGLCTFCVHPGGPDTAITHGPGTLFVGSIELILSGDVTTTCIPAIDLHVHKSRAPPNLS